MPGLRRHRFITVLVALASLLFMQLALAGYSCPGVESKVQEAAAMAEAGMPCAASMSMSVDDEQPGLCHAHCVAGQQASDNHPLQVPAVALSAGLDVERICVEPAIRSAPQATLLARSTAPPLTIRNCCLRN
jgi:hypothetical protein